MSTFPHLTLPLMFGLGGIISTIVVGIVAGWIAEQVMKANMGILMNLVIGVVGAFIGNIIAGLIPGIGGTTGESFSIWSLLVATGGAILLLFIVNKIRAGRTA